MDTIKNEELFVKKDPFYFGKHIHLEVSLTRLMKIRLMAINEKEEKGK